MCKKGELLMVVVVDNIVCTHWPLGGSLEVENYNNFRPTQLIFEKLCLKA